jgi:hypothetical protein
MLVSSVPLSLTHSSGRSRLAMTASGSRATAPTIEHARRSLIPCASRAAVTAILRAAGVTTFLT